MASRAEKESLEEELRYTARGGRSVAHMRELISRGVDLGAVDEFGRTALHYACANDHRRAYLEALIEAGAPLDVADEDGRTALHMACFLSSTDMVRALIEAGARVELVDCDGDTPLHYACNELDAVEMVRALVAAGAPLRLKNVHGWNPLLAAREKQFGSLQEIRQVARIIREAETDRNLGWRAATLQQRCWSAARRARLPVDGVLPPVVIRRNRQWEARHPWAATETPVMGPLEPPALY